MAVADEDTRVETVRVVTERPAGNGLSRALVALIGTLATVVVLGLAGYTNRVNESLRDSLKALDDKLQKEIAAQARFSVEARTSAEGNRQRIEKHGTDPSIHYAGMEGLRGKFDLNVHRIDMLEHWREEWILTIPKLDATQNERLNTLERSVLGIEPHRERP